MPIPPPPLEALGHAARYGTWRADPPEPVPDLDGLRQDLAEKLIDGFLAGTPAGGWLPTETTAELLGCYGITLADGDTVITADAAGVEVSIGVQHDQVFGPLVLLGPCGAAASMPADRTVRLAPLTSRDARELINAVVGARQLTVRPEIAVIDLAALEDILLRVSRLADDLPHIAELELNPVLARPDGVRVRVQAVEPADAFLRRLT
jgi:hypothetical protein